MVIYVWYDNEFGYTCQVIRTGQTMANIKYPIIPQLPVALDTLTASDADGVKLAAS